MKITLLLIVLLTAEFSAFTTSSDQQIPEFLNGGLASNPGLRVRISTTGFRHIVQVMGHAIDSVLTKTKLTPVDAILPFESGHINMNNFYVVGIIPPKTYSVELEPFSAIKINVGKMSVSNWFHFNSIIVSAEFLNGSITANGDGTADLQGLSFQDVIDAEPSEDGDFTFRSIRSVNGSESCILKLPDPTLRADLRDVMEQRMTPIVQKELVQAWMTTLKQYIEYFFTSQFNTMSQALELPENVEKTTVKSGTQNEGAHILESGQPSSYTFVTRLLRKPSVSTFNMESDQVGEVYFKQRVPLSFSPRAFPMIQSSARMITIQISDYVFNSYIYHRFKQSGLHIDATDKQTPSMSSLLRTTCTGKPDNGCFGTIFGKVPKKYPNHAVELKIVPNIPPYVQITSSGITQAINGTFTISGYILKATPQNRAFKTLVSGTINLIYNIKLQQRHNELYGSFAEKSMSINIQNSDFGAPVYQETTAALKRYGPTMMSERLKHVFKNGLTLPHIQDCTFTNPKIIYGDKLITIESDFEMNQNAVETDAAGYLNILEDKTTVKPTPQFRDLKGPRW